jgi:putative endonuclease
MSDNDTTTRTGRLAEDLAARFLEQRQMTVIECNYRCRGGEIDLICRDGKALVFVEVRLRRNGDFGGAAASITPVKQRRIAHAAQHYLVTKGKSDHDCRFDCVLLDGEHIEWIRNAFSAQ